MQKISQFAIVLCPNMAFSSRDWKPSMVRKNNNGENLVLATGLVVEK